MLALLRQTFPPPHRAGQPFIAGGLAVATGGAFLSGWLAATGLGFAAACLVFFRDPDRVAPPVADALLAPADGRIVAVVEVVPPADLELGEAPRWRISIFLSILDVHVNRMPAAGTVRAVRYRPGRFLNAGDDRASEANEHNAVVLDMAGGGTLAVVQIAGLVARRIRCAARAGDAVAAGERFGLIRFGSRTDLYLPLGALPWVRVGQRAVGSETILARPA